MTTVSMVTRGSPDMQADIVADGLIRMLGRQNVHLVTGVTNSGDTMKSQFFKGYKEPNTVGFHDTDALVISVRSGVATAEEWSRRTGRGAIAALDGEDDAVIRTDFVAAAKLYFKREYLTRKAHPQKVRPLPFGAIPEDLPPPAPRAGVFMRSRENHAVRGQLAALLRQMGHPVPADFLAKEKYNEELSRSLVGVSARGVGWDTYRYWEVPYFGAALLSERLGIQVPGDFRDGAEAVFFDGPREFPDKLNALLADRPRLDAIAEAGRRAVMERHLSIHRAKTVLEGVL